MSDKIQRSDVERWIELLRSGASTERLEGATELASLAVRTRSKGAVRTRGSATRAAPSRLPEPAVFSAALEAFKDQHSEVRSAVAFALGELADERAVQALRQIAGSDEDQAVRGEAVDALGKIGGKMAVVGLAATGRTDASDDVRVRAVRALADLARAESTVSGEVIATLEGLRKGATSDAVRGQIDSALSRLGRGR